MIDLEFEISSSPDDDTADNNNTAIMVRLTLAALALQASAALAAPVTAFCGARPFGLFVNNTIYQPVKNEVLTYPRFVETEDGTIFATASMSGRSPSTFPIFESKDGGATWEHISEVADTVNGFGMSAQPALTELTEPMGGLPKGTILASGNSWSNTSTRIDLYASTDRARTWKFVSHIAEGGRPNTTNGATPIWEPYLL